MKTFYGITPRGVIYKTNAVANGIFGITMLIAWGSVLLAFFNVELFGAVLFIAILIGTVGGFIASLFVK